MIYTEEDFKETQEWIVEMERSLDDLRRQVKPISEQKFHIMAQGLISQIRQMREEIDEYLGIVPYDDPVTESQVPVHV